MRKTLMFPLLAVIALLAAVLPVASPAFAAPSAGTRKPVPPPPPPSSSSFVKAFVDTRATNNAAFGNDVAQAADGTYYVTGTVGIPGNGWVAHVSATGTLIWQKQFTNGFSSVQATADGGVIAAGGIVVKLSSAGVVQWEKSYPGLFQAGVSQIRQTTDGGYIIAGNTNPQGNSDPFAYIARLTSSGDLMWQRVLGSTPFATALSVVQLPSGGFAITGSSGAINSSSVLVAAFSATGDLQWQKTYGVGNEDLGESIQAASDGSLVVGGEVVTENKGNGARPSEGLLLKLDPQGNIQFQDVFNAGTFFDVNGFPEQASSEVTSVQVASDGSIFLAGRDDPLAGPGGSGPEESWLVKTDPSGTVSWQHVFFTASGGFSQFNGMRLTSDGGLIAAGTTDAFDHSDNFWLVKTDASGNVAGGQCTAQASSTNTTEQTGQLTAATSSFPVVTPSTSATDVTDTPADTSLVTMAVC